MPGAPQRHAIGSKAFGARARLARALFASRGSPVPSQAWLAAQASSYLEGDEISQPTVGTWLAGKTLPDTALRAWAFAKALGVDPGWLVFGDTSAAPAPDMGTAPAPTPRAHPPTETFDDSGEPIPRRRAPGKKRAG